MSFTLNSELLVATKDKSLKDLRERADHYGRARYHAVDVDTLTAAAIADIRRVATEQNDGKTLRALDAIADAKSGAFTKPVPNFKAFQSVLEAFLSHDPIDGWVYATGNDGRLYPELVTSITFDDGISGRGVQGTPSVTLHTTSYGYATDGNYRVSHGVQHNRHTFNPDSVARRTIVDILARHDLFKETPALRAAHDASIKRFRALVRDGFGQQFRATGGVHQFEENAYARRGLQLANRRVLHDMAADDYGPVPGGVESCVFEKDKKAAGVGEIPEHPVVRVFDLKTHEFLWMHSDGLTPHVYDKSLRDKLILPHSHRDLLDVLTTNLDAFVSDIIEDKSAGNVILCKGLPGLGKTLTPEVYSELIERPLYSIHSGNLGTTAEAISTHLQEVFQRAKRWGCVLLLDEADVFVVKRGADIEQNAIVAEFLRTLEYFDGLMFMTTNRPEDIDDAIIQRCAAIIEYKVPPPDDTAAIWQVMATQFKADLPATLATDLLDLLPSITPRDIKMLLRLALRVAAKDKVPLSLDLFRRCAMFRAVEISETKSP